jgi:hypothetical protein
LIDDSIFIYRAQIDRLNLLRGGRATTALLNNECSRQLHTRSLPFASASSSLM